MAINLRMIDSVLEANDYEIVDLGKPFLGSVDKRKYKRRLKLLPSETLQKPKTIAMYRCQLDRYNFAALYRLYAEDLMRCHAVYKTVRSVSKLFKSKSLQKLLLDDSQVRESAMFYISRVLNVVVKSGDFEFVVTDFEIPGLITPQFVNRWGINKFPDEYSEEMGLLSKIFNATRIPLLSLDGNIRKFDPEKHTDIDISVIGDHRNVIVLSGINGFYASYLTDYFYSKMPDREFLPLTLFVL